MDHQITAEDPEFMRWLDSKECDQYWDKDENGENVILRSGWEKAQEKHNRVNGFKENQKTT